MAGAGHAHRSGHRGRNRGRSDPDRSGRWRQQPRIAVFPARPAHPGRADRRDPGRPSAGNRPSHAVLARVATRPTGAPRHRPIHRVRSDEQPTAPWSSCEGRGPAAAAAHRDAGAVAGPDPDRTAVLGADAGLEQADPDRRRAPRRSDRAARGAGRDPGRPRPGARRQHVQLRHHGQPFGADGRAGPRQGDIDQAGRVDRHLRHRTWPRRSPLRHPRARSVLDRAAVPARPGDQERVQHRPAGGQRARARTTRAWPSRPRRSAPTRAARLAAQTLGYTGQVSAADEKANKTLDDFDTIGRSGLESSYDTALRGKDGYQTVKLDPRGNAVGDGATVPATAGDTLVTSIDGGLQDPGREGVEGADHGLAHGRLCRARRRGDRHGPEHRPDPRRGQLSDVRPRGVRRRHLRGRLPQADRAVGQQPVAVPGHRRGVRTWVRRSNWSAHRRT